MDRSSQRRQRRDLDRGCDRRRHDLHPAVGATGLSATAISSSQINLSWSAVSGATQYRIYRSTTSGGPYSQIGTSATTSFSNTGLSASTTYYYVVTAFASCESSNSAQASATTQSGGGGTCTTSTLYTNSFESGTGLSNWTKGTFVSGGATTEWRGIQTCTAQGGTKIFRFGGTSCTANYGSNRFSFAKPQARPASRCRPARARRR
ncbi:MAG: fibronectin type III domain-containing protein [Thermoanaerobaculia bacterium]|nr:fibronectin type III domain-containing protein [Thermoanaerobaculia bacterium]